MLLRPFLAASVLSLAASAFLVVPSVSESIETVATAEDVRLQLHQIGAQNRDLQLPCSECSFPEKSEDGQINLVDNVENAVILHISAENKFLHINHQPIFPPPENFFPLTVTQIRKSDGQISDPVPVGVIQMEVFPVMPPQDGNELLSVRFTILQVNGRPVLVDTVVLNVIRTQDGELLIASTEVEATADDHLSWKQCGHDASCLKELLFSRIQSLLASAKARLAKISSGFRFGKGCQKGKGGHRGPLPDHHGPEGHHRPEGHHKPEDHRMPGGHRHHPHGHHRHHHGWHGTISRAVRFIVIPALLGVMAGLAASSIGMLVGQLIVFLWLRYRRVTNRTCHPAPSTVECGTFSEKEVLISEISEELPPYSDEDLENAHPVDSK